MSDVVSKQYNALSLNEKHNASDFELKSFRFGIKNFATSQILNQRFSPRQKLNQKTFTFLNQFLT